MKVLLINGSPRANGNTARALKEVADTLAAAKTTSARAMSDFKMCPRATLM